MSASIGTEQPEFSAPKISRPRFLRYFFILLAMTLAFRLVNLSHPPKFYFDEVYHGFTATQYLQGNLQAYDPFAKPPSGVAFEWTHPPLAKLLMTGMLLVFGENSFGWRVGSALFGTASVGLTVLVALELFGSPVLALMAGALLSMEGLFFVQSRLAMNDVYIIFFALVALLFYLKWKKSGALQQLYLSGTFLGLAAASKWTTIYVFMILGIDFAATLKDRWQPPVQSKKDKRRKFTPPPRPIPWIHLPIVFIVIPTALYLLSYTQYFWLGGTWDGLKEIQRQMWVYHTNLKASHQFQSAPWQWIFNLRPVWMWVDYAEGKISNIYNIGNSVILIAGLGAAIWTLFLDKVRTTERRFVLLCYFMLWVPWSISPRIMLFYHYAPALPFLCILLARTVEICQQKKPEWGRKPTIVLLSASLFWFALFFPHMTGLQVPRAFADTVYFALPTWK